MGNRVAPHKAVLLLAISDLIEEGVLSSPLIPLDDCLNKAFSARWKRHVPINSGFNCMLSYPFFHLASSSFWELIPLKSPDRKIMKEYSSLLHRIRLDAIVTISPIRFLTPCSVFLFEFHCTYPSPSKF